MLILRSRRFLRRGNRRGQPIREDQEDSEELVLVTEGPYRRKRHPMFSGFILVKIGFGIALSSVYMLIWAGVFIILRILNGRLEERKLARIGGEDWLDYRKRTAVMFFPGYIWVILSAVYGAAWAGFLF